ncbi:MAG: NADH-quinone oxidoreductase subunit J [Acidimicrobiia bacterium]|jgi:NADH-quinone oxidoreductase subunit J|nr:NADH-quinone oxidoreductase subunit J [Acidimicrobiia bacterium]MDQ3392261.1 NADH-quinone oxidoreductase subunit J [Actinomycetota bacterium]
MVPVLLAASEVNVALNVAFGVLAVVMIGAALFVVTTKNVVHAALWLVIVLSGMAAQYLLAAAEFVAVSQVLVYVGAVMVLFLFGIMLTRAQIGAEGNLNNPGWALGIPVALLLLGVMGWAIIDLFGDQTIEEAPGGASTQAISDQILSPYLAPFLAITFVLLAAAIGAIVLARKD